MRYGSLRCSASMPIIGIIASHTLYFLWLVGHGVFAGLSTLLNEDFRQYTWSITKSEVRDAVQSFAKESIDGGMGIILTLTGLAIGSAVFLVSVYLNRERPSMGGPFQNGDNLQQDDDSALQGDAPEPGTNAGPTARSPSAPAR